MFRVMVIALLAQWRADAYGAQFGRQNPLLLDRPNPEDDGYFLEGDYYGAGSDSALQISPESAEELVKNVFMEDKRSDGSVAIGERDKKGLMECAVNKVTREFQEQGFGYATLPKKFSEYECVPVTTGLSKFAPPFVHLQEHEICLAKHCESVEKKMYYLKKDSEASCWSLSTMVVKAGCACAAHKKFGIHSQH